MQTKMDIIEEIKKERQKKKIPTSSGENLIQKLKNFLWCS
jgi:hypothetical protein